MLRKLTLAAFMLLLLPTMALSATYQVIYKATTGGSVLPVPNPGLGYVKVTVTTPPKSINFKASPNFGYAIAGAALTNPGDGIVSAIATDGTFSVTPAANTTLTVSFVKAPGSVVASIAPVNQTVAGIGSSYKASLTGLASVSPAMSGLTYTYAWTASGPGTTTLTAPSSSTTQLYVDTYGTYSVSLVVTANGKASAPVSANVKFVAPGAYDSEVCIGCHATRSPAIVAAYQTSIHSNSAHSACNSCHRANVATGDMGQVSKQSVYSTSFLTKTVVNGMPAGTVFCTQCHKNNGPGFDYSIPHNTTLNAGQTCAKCHTDATGHNAGTGDAHSIKGLPKCIECHSVAQKQVAANMVNDNDGVRAITTEFAKWSHHVTGVTLNDAHCAACHLEGKVSNGEVVVDSTKHMVDAKTHLRNADDDTDLQWDPADANHTTMDTFCMSCHDANGATSNGSAAIQAFINTIPAGAGRSGTASPLNPFGDTISNQYDQLSRGAVVAVKEQFDAGNTSHHGVRAPRYTNNTLSIAQFSNISSANYANGTLGISRNTQPTDPTLLATVGTMSETGKFVTLYKPFSTPNAAVADNTQLHCADCHTVGQWKAGSSVDAYGNPTTVVLGAHGSQNEYMLRNSNGSDSVGPKFNNLSSNNIAQNTYMVCFLCHTDTQYGNGTPANSHSAAISHTGSSDCNGGGNNNAGLVGSAKRIERTWAAGVLENGKLGSGGAGNVFGQRCANCHNSSDNKLFGGIHGNAARVGATTAVTLNVGYKSYSGANGATAAPTNVVQGSVVDRKPYRFLPGLGNFRYNGGVDSDAWTRKSIGATGKSEKMGCYTLNGASSKGTVNGVLPSVSPTKAQLSGTNVSPSALADDNGILGAWGACTDHAGSSVGAAGHSVTRTSIRPLTY